MASLQLLKRRITAAQNVSKSTRAMQMIAASKMKRAQEAALSARPYVEKLTVMTQNAGKKVDMLFTNSTFSHPYITQNNKIGKTLLIVLSPDKGLCGGLITNLVREFLNFTREEKSYYMVLGKKMEAKVSHIRNDVIASFPFGTTLPTFDMVYPIIRIIDEYYLGGKVNTVKILTTKFTSIFSQVPNVTQLLPLAIPEGGVPTQAIFEPRVQTMLPPLLKHYIEMTVYQQLLESFVSEQAARMIAMQNATDNALDLVSDLNLTYNQTRQDAITKELLEITTAAMAMQ